MEKLYIYAFERNDLDKKPVSIVSMWKKYESHLDIIAETFERLYLDLENKKIKASKVKTMFSSKNPNANS